MKKTLTFAMLMLAAAMTCTAGNNWGSFSVMLDPGHGGSDPGASGPSAPHEAELALRCSNSLASLLNGVGCPYRMTRYDNSTVSLTARRDASVSYDPWIFNSIHLNAFNGTAHGTETWYYWDAGNSHNLANYVQGALVANLGRANRGVKQNGWTVITGSSGVPAILTEGLFVDNWTEWDMINSTDKAGFQSWVRGHMEGWINYLQGVHGASLTNPFSGSSTPTPDPTPAEIADVPLQRNAYAYDVTVDDAVRTAPRISYKLNTPAALVVVDLFVAGQKVASRSVQSDATAGTVQFNNISGHGVVTASVTAHSKTDVAVPTRVDFNKDNSSCPVNKGIFKFYWPYTVAVNNDTESPTFGNLLVGEGSVGPGSNDQANYYSTCSTGRGMNMIYAFDPRMQGIINTHTNTYGFNANLTLAGDSYSRQWQRLRFSPDGRLFAAASNLNGGGLYELNPGELNTQAVKVFGGSQNTSTGEYLNGSTLVGGAAFGLSLWGKGANLKVACMMSNQTADGHTGTSWLGVYNLGTAKTWSAAPSKMSDGRGSTYVSSLQPDLYNMKSPSNMHVLFDNDGAGALLTCNGWGTDGGDVSAIHMNFATMAQNYSDMVGAHYFGNTNAVAYNKDYSLMALSWFYSDNPSVSYFDIYHLDWHGNGAMPTYTMLWRTAVDDSRVLGTYVRDMAFDYANNLYLVNSTTSTMVGFQLPWSYAGRAQTTPAAARYNYYLDCDPQPATAEASSANDIFFYTAGSVVKAFNAAAMDTLVIDHKADRLKLYVDGQKAYDCAFASVDSLSMTAPHAGADVLDVRFNPDGSATDISPMHNAVEAVSANGSVTVRRNAAFGKYTAHLTNGWSGYNPAKEYLRVPYASNQAFKNALAGGHTVELLYRPRFDDASKLADCAPMSSQAGGGCGFWYDTANSLCYYVKTQTPDVDDQAWRKAAHSGVTANDRYCHLVGVWDKAANQVRIYVNGQLSNAGNTVGNYVGVSDSSQEWFAIGGDVGDVTASCGVDAEIVSARIYGRPLTNNQVANLWAEVAETVNRPVATLLDMHINADGTVTDVSPMCNQVKTVGNPQISDGGIKFDNAWNAVPSQYCRVDYAGNEEFKQALCAGHSIECEFRPDGTPAAGTVFGGYDSAGSGIYIDSDLKIAYSAWIGSGYAIAKDDTPAVAGRWYDVVGQYDRDAGCVRLYINGVLKAQTAVSGNMSLPRDAAQWYAVGGDTNGETAQDAAKVTVRKARIYGHAVAP